ncbi:signal transduction histidine kinase [Frondihabitans sp. PhB188]|uniref:sensor histidine kinase n=1 Tax=Frondihabitans sp. PhB188 TaxID=2485200 RepID=UPI000F48BBF7|nr:histidine kinase [Frondihabitans sp. PhB188]ROQ40894.1 signal transduction histidine kinase [Frondihabitans sp. PhB188]
MWTSLDRRPFAVDVIVGVVAFGFFGCLDVFRTGWITLPVDALFALALVFRRRSPGTALGISWLGALVQLLVLPSFINGNVMLAVVIFATSLSESRLVRRLGLASSLAGGVVASVKLVLITGLFLPHGQHASQLAVSRVIYFVGVAGVIAAALSLFWLLGTITGTRRALIAARLERLEGDQELLRAELRVAQETERTRLSREMHDVIGHSLAVIIAQSDGARYAVAKNPQAATDALGVINQSARSALDDVSDLLNVLSGGDGHEGSLGIADLEGLVANLRSSGLVVEVAETGHRLQLSTAGDLALYRVVQEALTNALKHGGPGTRVDVAISWTVDGVGVTTHTTEDGGPGLIAEADRPRLGGYGLAGMVERVRLVGGTVESGPRVDGVTGFGVAARIPHHPGAPE